MAQPVILCLTPRGEALATRLAGPLGAAVHGRAGRTEAAATFAETVAHVRDLFAAGVPVIGICAAGILIRAVAPLLSDKRAEPPVLAVAEDGSAVVPLLGGHRGANALARRIAGVLGIPAAVTTASDLEHGIALDAPPPGWTLATPDLVPAAMARLSAGAGARVGGDEARRAGWLDGLPAGDEIEIECTMAPARAGILTYQPMRATLGVGCARDCPPAELAALVGEMLAEAELAPGALAAIATIDLKADERAVLELQATLGRPLRLFTAEELEAETPRLETPSEVVFAEVGCHGVAEGAALATAGPEGVLWYPKRKSAAATCALGLAPAPITDLPGRRRGQVSLVGIGPGQPEWRTPEASRLIVEADELVGYGFYIDLLGPLAAGKPRTDFPLGGEEDRCRYALEEAAKGREIAIICSGDAGIYAMGALVYELIARTEHGVSEAARRVEVVTAPGISALQAAAARIGAPLGHDFCTISLSDLLTPRADILSRIGAAASGNFVIAFYNPVSKRRKDLFVKAIDILSGHRPPETPVVLATNLGRPEESVRLRRLDTVHVDEVDMMTVVLVGSRQSRLCTVGGAPRMFTPRGYAAKHRAAAP